MKRASLVILMALGLLGLNFLVVAPSAPVLAAPSVTYHDNSPGTAIIHKAIALRYVRGYSLQNGWFCYGWPTYFHCTLSWRHENKPPYTGIISLNPAWVPNGMNSIRTGTTQTVAFVAASSSGGWSYKFLPGEFCRSLDFGGGAISQWSVPPSCYSSIYFPNPNFFRVGWNGFGWCNWWPEALRPQYPTIWDDPFRGSVPRPGATVFFSGGVQGASADGHYALVVAVSPGGYWVLVTEMNFYWRGGGWQKVDYRYIHVGWGVTFLY